MKFGTIDRYMLIGGSQLLFHTAKMLIAKNQPLNVITSRRHLAAIIQIDSTAGSLEHALHSIDVEFHISDDIDTDEKVHDLIGKQTLGISLSSAWIFKKEFINRFSGRLLNVHGHPLPMYRGGAGFSWDVMNKTRYSGCNVHLVEPGIDTGDILDFRDYHIPISCRKPIDYQNFTVSQNTKFLEEFLLALDSNQDFQPIQQNNHLSSYWPRLNTEVNGFIDWNWDLSAIESFICAFDDPYEGASTYLNDQKVHIKDCFSEYGFGTFHPFQSGIIFKKSFEALHVAAVQGTLVINEINNEAGDSLFQDIRLGDRLHTPQDYLDRARRVRPVYTADSMRPPNL